MDFVAHGVSHSVADVTVAAPFKAPQQSQHFVAQGVMLLDVVAHGTDVAHFVAHFLQAAAFKASEQSQHLMAQGYQLVDSVEHGTNVA